MNIFVTGGTGFLGSEFIKKAIHAKHKIWAISRSQITTRDQHTNQLTWVTADLARKYEQIYYPASPRMDALVHFAAAGVNPKKREWSSCFLTNVLGPIALWKTAAQTGTPRLVICGSCFEYGDAGSEYDRIPPNAPLRPVDAYGASKAAASTAAIALSKQYKLECVVLRPFQVYGIGEPENRFWPSLYKAAINGQDFHMTSGKQIRDFINVSSVANTFLNVATKRNLERGNTEIHNLGSGKPSTLLDFAEYWWKKWEASGRLLPGVIPYRADEVMRYVPEITL